jgi:hypothetical protein
MASGFRFCCACVAAIEFLVVKKRENLKWGGGFCEARTEKTFEFIRYNLPVNLWRVSHTYIFFLGFV